MDNAGNVKSPSPAYTPPVSYSEQSTKNVNSTQDMEANIRPIDPIDEGIQGARALAKREFTELRQPFCTLYGLHTVIWCFTIFYAVALCLILAKYEPDSTDTWGIKIKSDLPYTLIPIIVSISLFGIKTALWVTDYRELWISQDDISCYLYSYCFPCFAVLGRNVNGR